MIPGVGHFNATAGLRTEWRAAIQRRIAAGTGLLGICLGLQWLFDGSDEAPGLSGLGVFPGSCFRLRGDVKVPHVGWNTLRTLSDVATPRRRSAGRIRAISRTRLRPRSSTRRSRQRCTDWSSRASSSAAA